MGILNRLRAITALVGIALTAATLPAWAGPSVKATARALRTAACQWSLLTATRVLETDDGLGRTKLQQLIDNNLLEEAEAAWMVLSAPQKAEIMRTADHQQRTLLHSVAAFDGKLRATLTPIAEYSAALMAHENAAASQALERRLRLLTAFLEAGARCDIVDVDGNTPLHNAAYSGELRLVQPLLSQPGINTSARNHNHDTPLHWAVRWDLAVTQALINAGADTSAVNRRGDTILHDAALATDAGIFEYLLTMPSQKPLDLTAPDAHGITPLDWFHRVHQLDELKTTEALAILDAVYDN